MHTEPKFQSYESGGQTGNLEPAVQLVRQLSRFIDLLPGYAQSVRDQRRMEFIVQSDVIYLYPELVRDWLMTRELTAIHVTTVTEDGMPESTTLEFSCSDENSEFYISRREKQADVLLPIDTSTGPITPNSFENHPLIAMLATSAKDDQGSDYDLILQGDGRVEPVGHVDGQEINAFLLTLCQKRWAAEMQPDGEPVISDQLIDALHKNAFQSEVDRTYALDSGRVIQLRTERLSDKTKLASFAIYYETGSERVLRATVDMGEGLTVAFATCDKPSEGFGEGLYELPFVNKLIPDEGDYVRLTEILEEEANIMSALSLDATVTPLEFVDDHTVSDPSAL